MPVTLEMALPQDGTLSGFTGHRKAGISLVTVYKREEDRYMW